MKRLVAIVHRVSTDRLAVLCLCLLAVVLMFPRLKSAQFGLFDDPTTIVTVQKLLAGDFHWDQDSGRFRPMYWLYYTALYAIFGQRPFWFFAANAGLLALLGIASYAVVWRSGRKPFHAWLAAALLLLSAPIIENTYTLSKPELQQSVWLALFWLATCQDLSGYRLSQKVLVFSLAGLAALLNCLAKETGVILPVILLAWTITAWILARLKVPLRFSARQRLWWTLAAAMGVGLFFWLRSDTYSFALTEQGYGANFFLQPDYLLEKVKSWVSWLKRDYLYLVPLLGLPFIVWIQKRAVEHLQSSLEALVWMGAWILIYIPWMFTVEYYLLPFGIGAAILVSNLVSSYLAGFRSSKNLWRAAGAIILVASGFFLIITLPNNYSNARLQLATDASNEAMLRYVADELPPQSIVLVNIQDPNEYVGQAETRLLAIEHRADLQFDYFHNQRFQKEFYVLLPTIENQFFPSVRTGVSEASALRWNQLLVEHYGTSGELVYETRHSFHYLTIQNMWLFCPIGRWFGYCENIKSAIRQDEFAYGWQVRRITPGVP